jgi:hypothetical protein
VLSGRQAVDEEGERMKSMKRVLEVLEVAVMALLFGPGLTLRGRRS